MRKVMLWNDKGGVGKSTSAVNGSAALARLGKKVLLVDVDPQCNSTAASGFMQIWNSDNPPASTFDLMLKKRPVEEAIVRAETCGYDIITNSPMMKWYHDEWGQYYGFENFLKEALEPIKDYDFVIFDSAPMMVAIVKMIIVYADELYVPLSTDYFGASAFVDLFSALREIHERLNPKIILKGIFHTMMRPSAHTRKTMETVRELYSDVLMDSVIRYSEPLKNAALYGTDIFSYDAKSNGALDYAAWAEEVLSQGE